MPLLFCVRVRLFGHDGRLFKIERGGRGSGFPFQALGLPRIVSGYWSVFERPDEIDQRDNVAEAQHGSARARHYVENLKLRRVSVVAARLPQISGDELGEEREVEPRED